MKNIENDRKDWSRQILPGATIDHLDKEAIALAREKYKEKMNCPHVTDEANDLTDEEFLTKLHLMSGGKVANAAVLLLGNPENNRLLKNKPSIMWRLYGPYGNLRDYESFTIPYINVTERVVTKIRLLTYRYMVNPKSLTPAEIQQYDTRILHELVNNSIAHSNYSLERTIYVDEDEEEGCVRMTNPGSFLPRSVENVLLKGFTHPSCRNQLLVDTMAKLNMIDATNSGMKHVYRILRERYFPMPDYNLNSTDQVSVTVYGKILNQQYTYMLFTHPELDQKTVYLLDQVQKGKSGNLSKEDIDCLKKHKLVEEHEGRLVIPLSVFWKSGVREETNNDEEFYDRYYFDIITSHLNLRGNRRIKDVDSLLKTILPDSLSDRQKKSRINDLVSKLRRERAIVSDNDMNGWYPGYIQKQIQ